MTGARAVQTGNYPSINAPFFQMRTLRAIKGSKAQLARTDTLHGTSAIRAQVASGAIVGTLYFHHRIEPLPSDKLRHVTGLHSVTRKLMDV